MTKSVNDILALGTLTLRDYFAAAALPQIMACESILGSPEIAYRVADEMLRARKNDNLSNDTPA